MPTIELATGAVIDYEHEVGQSDKLPVIALHGMLGTGRTHLGHVIEWLAEQGYPVYAPTLRGYGKSTPKPRDFPPNFYERDADDVLAFMEALNIDKAHLLGYSDGGEIVLISAGKQPNRVATVGVWGAVGYFGQEIRPVVQAQSPGSQWISQELLDLHGIPNADIFARGWQRAFIQMIDRGGNQTIKLAPNITMPVLIMLGKSDSLNPASYAEHFLSHIENGELVLFDCGHAVHDEQTQLFQKAVLKHLQGAPA